MHITLFDLPQARQALRPFTDIRPIAKIRVGITTIEEKWQNHLIGDYAYLTAFYLKGKFPGPTQSLNYYINATVLPSQALVTAIEKLQVNEQLVQGNTLLAFATDQPISATSYENNLQDLAFHKINFQEKITQLQNKWDIFLYNEQCILADFQHIQSNNHTSHPIQDPYTKVYNESAIYVADNVSIRAAILNAEHGPIYIGSNATIEEGAIIKGPVAICEGAQIKAGAIIQQATTVGPYAKVGGEVTNSVIFGYSNKAHHGFLGHSVIGEWCNLGAGTNTSNLKNNYGSIQVWDYTQEEMIDSQLQYCGLFMGDHSKCGINTMFNAGTVVGVHANLYGTGYHPKWISSFTKGGTDNQSGIHHKDKALEAAERMMQRRNQAPSETDQAILTYLADDAITDWIKARL